MSPDDLVLEVGSGTGSLTVRLLEQAGAVASVEVDPAFAIMTDEAVYKDRDRVALIQADALKSKNELNPDVLRDLADLKQRTRCPTFKVVANLPYAIAVPIISNVLLSDLNPERLVVTVQWEIAERLTATVGTKPYGAALAVMTQSVADVTIVRRLPPTVFWPRPKVDSAIVLIRPNAVKSQAHRRCDAISSFSAQPLCSSAQEPGAERWSACRMQISARKRWTRSWRSWGLKGRSVRRRWT